MKKVLITGATGFAGSFLCEYLLSLGNYEITGTYLSEKSLETIESCRSSINAYQINLLEESHVQEMVSSVKPDFIYHLAAFTSPADSFSNPQQTIINNVTGQIHLLEAARQADLKGTKILIVSSSDIYGKVDPQNLPINEETPFNPTNPYSVSKITQDMLGLQYFFSYNLSIVRVRPFNHIGPRQTADFVASAFAKRIAEMEKHNHHPVIAVGNLDAKRDFTDVRDMVMAYQQILEKGKIGDVYNIGSGKSYKIADILDMLLSETRAHVQVEQDQRLLRPTDVPELLCDNTKVQEIIDWQPKIPIEETLKDILDYWRGIV